MRSLRRQSWMTGVCLHERAPQGRSITPLAGIRTGHCCRRVLPPSGAEAQDGMVMLGAAGSPHPVVVLEDVPGSLDGTLQGRRVHNCATRET